MNVNSNRWFFSPSPLVLLKLTRTRRTSCNPGTRRGRITENAGPGGLSNSRCFCAPLFGPDPITPIFLTKREVKSLNAGVQEFDLESPVFYLLAICGGKAQPSEGSLVANRQTSGYADFC
jgi:hypothetical protein